MQFFKLKFEQENVKLELNIFYMSYIDFKCVRGLFAFTVPQTSPYAIVFLTFKLGYWGMVSYHHYWM